ncbi:MAG: hypothetical protein EBV49_09725, partial [Betaproteobacteria bacterium]|nr:hypothetical protein [Betaproteobacteria bacterium]
MMRALFFRLLARDFQAGHLTLLGLALAISVFAMATVLSLADRFERSIKARAASLLAADVLLVSDHPIDPRLPNEAQRLDRYRQVLEPYIYHYLIERHSPVLNGFWAQYVPPKAAKH